MLGRDVKTEISRDLTQSQLAIWTGQKLSPAVPLYNMAFTFSFNGEIDSRTFQKAFQILIDKSDVMRTVFCVEDDIPIRKVHESFSYKTQILDWSTEESSSTKLQRFVNENIGKKLDLADCLFDSVLIKLEEKKYVWFINQHHLITDGWSITVQYKTLADIYGRLLEGEPTADIEIPSFQNFLDYEKKIGTRFCDSTVENYWDEKLELIPKPPKLYGHNSEKHTTETTRTTIELGKDRVEKLRKIAVDKRISLLTPELTIFNIFATILFAYLYRISGEEKIAIGTPSHNRVTKEFQNSLGVFIEFFPILSDIEKGDTFLTLYNCVKNENYWFLKNAKTARSNPKLGKSFNVILNYFTANFSDFAGAKCEPTWHHSGHFDFHNHLGIEVYDFEQNGNYKVNFDIKDSVIPIDNQKEAITHFMSLLDAFLSDFDRSIDDVDILSNDEKKQIFEFGNATKKSKKKTQTILDLFKKQVEKSPEKKVVQYKGKTLTFKELDEKSNQLANHLIKLGVKAESRVGLFIERSTNLLVGLYGILKAGGAYVPLDAMYPKERMKYIIDDASISVVISQESLADKVPKDDCQHVNLDSDLERICAESKEQPSVQITAANLAYLIYTSGSTGTPKGAMNEHGSVIHLLEKITDSVYSRYEGSLNLSLVSPCVFDASILPIFASTLLGHKLIIAPENLRFDGRELSHFYVSSKIDVADVTPAHLRLLLKSAKHKKVPRHFIIGGETLSSSLLSDFHNKFDGNEYIISNIYGVAESCVDSTIYDIKSGEKVDYANVPIGKPFLHDRIYILNEANQVQPIGTLGEICIGGTTVGRGYLNLENYTKKKFVQNPYITHERIFKTGDLGYFLPDGNIQYIGRKDNQVNINGNRIELGEIESRLLAFNKNDEQKIKDVVVIVKKDSNENKFLCAYLVANAELKFSEVRTHLSRFLPKYMIPHRFVQMKKLPLTTNGKIDKKSLPFPEINIAEFEGNYLAPKTEIEEVIAEIWSEVLQSDKIGVFDDFIEIGGNSLAAIRVMTRLNDRVELDLPLNLVFEKPTISQLAEIIEKTILEMLENVNV